MNIDDAICSNLFQLQRDLAGFSNLKSGLTPLSVQTLLERWQLFCEKPPKGFEKYYKDKKENTAEAGAEKKASDSASTSSKAAPMSKPPGADLKKSANSDWNFGMFNPTSKSGGSGGSGRPIGGEGNGDRDKWLLVGALGVAGFLGLIAFMEMNYREIGWKEFVNT